MPESLLQQIEQFRRTSDDAGVLAQVWAWFEHDPSRYLQGVADALGLRGISTDTLATLQPRFDLIPYAECSAHRCVFGELEGAGLVMVLSNPFAPAERLWAMQRHALPFSFGFAIPEDITALLTSMEGAHRAMSQVGSGDSSADNTDQVLEINLQTLAAETHPVIQLVNSSLYDALRARASDIHIESTQTGLVIKYRIDGVLLESGQVAGVANAEQAISRLKVMAELDIGERRVPQDGRFKAFVSGREIDFRVSIMPSIHGEDAVLRVLDKQRGQAGSGALKLDNLGHDPDTVAAIRNVAREPYGLILVTGPTGSGKSTTLYAVLTEINTGEEKIITIEDPVEYELDGVLQIPVNEKKGLTFARGLRSVLRHDPDKILVGEIRDGETAGIAVQAALTGHLVLSSVHANNVFSVLDRFLHMGLDIHSFVDSLLGVVAQRLMRINCPHCSQPDTPSAASLQASLLTQEDVAGWSFHRGAGCEQCRNTGYLGRRPVAEVLRMNDALRQAFIERRPLGEIKPLALANGYVPIRQVALRGVAAGTTTLEEVNRVTLVE